MNYITVKFIGKEYSIPQDVLTYIDLLSFTDSVQKQLFGTFVRKLKNEIAKDNIGLLGDEDLATEIEQQIGRFIAKLCDNGIFTRTISDYLKNNKGYQLISEVNKAALNKMKSLLIQEMEDWKAGYENAVNNAESHVTGMGFSIWSSSFVNHAIYAAMESSKLKEQSKEAEAQYQKDMSDLRSRLDSQYGGEKSNYINNTYIPSMEAALTVFAYELLDKYISDLIASDKFDGKTLDYVDIGRSNDLLKNLTLSNNKKAILENAFVACPYNIAVYMQAMKMEMLDEDTFETANIFKQGSKIISFLKESLGAADYPNFVEPNYYSAMLLARYTNKSTNDVLHQHTASYANAIIREYGNIVKALNNSNQCREYLRKLNDDEILSGEGTSKRLANSLVHSIAPDNAWTVLVEKCGHSDIFERLLAVMPVGISFDSKADCDSYLAKALFQALEATRKDLAQKISESRDRAEAERQKLEAQKRKKRIKTTAIVCAIIAVVIFVISLPTIIENAKIAKRESYVEKQIQEVVMPLERQMEDATGVDIIIDYSFSLENDWDTEQWYEWTFSVKLPIFEEYRKSNSATDQALLEVMDVCKTLVEIYDNIYDELDFDSNEGDVRIVMDFSGGNFGSLKIHDTSTLETFYYEEHSGNRYLHSSNTEYVLDENSEVIQAAQKEVAYNEALALMSAQNYDEAIEIFVKLSGYKDSVAKIAECENAIIELKYNQALALMSTQKYDDAIKIFTELGGYKNSADKINECNNAIAAIKESKYNEASSLITEGKYKDALALLDEVGDYKDAKKLRAKCKLVTCESGDIITFGTYEQDGNLANGTEDIEWIVITRDGNKALVISKYCLDQMPFNSTLASVTWKNSTIRTWLNSDFYNNAFSSEERSKIFNTTFSTEGVETTDKVFLLDEEDASFLPLSIRKAKATDYVSTTHCYWFLRNTGSASNAAYVSYDGEVGYYEDVDRNWWIRPVMWIDVDYGE